MVWIEWLIRNSNCQYLKSPVLGLGFIAGNAYDVIAFITLLITGILVALIKLACFCRNKIRDAKKSSAKCYITIIHCYITISYSPFLVSLTCNLIDSSLNIGFSHRNSAITNGLAKRGHNITDISPGFDTNPPAGVHLIIIENQYEEVYILSRKTRREFFLYKNLVPNFAEVNVYKCYKIVTKFYNKLSTS